MGGGSGWSGSLPTCKAARSSRSTTRPRATGSRSTSETAAPGDVGRQPRGLQWEPRALDALEQLAEYMPAAARDALNAMERMASTGFNYGRLDPQGAPLVPAHPEAWPLLPGRWPHVDRRRRRSRPPASPVAIACSAAQQDPSRSQESIRRAARLFPCVLGSHARSPLRRMPVLKDLGRGCAGRQR